MMAVFRVSDDDLSHLSASLHAATGRVEDMDSKLLVVSGSVGQRTLEDKVHDFADKSLEETEVALAMMRRIQEFLKSVSVETSKVDGELSVSISDMCTAVQ